MALCVEGTVWVKVQKWRKAGEAWSLNSLWEVQGKEQEGGLEGQLTPEGRGPDSRLSTLKSIQLAVGTTQSKILYKGDRWLHVSGALEGYILKYQFVSELMET